MILNPFELGFRALVKGAELLDRASARLNRWIADMDSKNWESGDRPDLSRPPTSERRPAANDGSEP